ncbi:hypothetical protein OC834_002881 [Tilletia horrida]|nr:hypothetical protein OC834_002881 [Tilletia horrida]
MSKEDRLATAPATLPAAPALAAPPLPAASRPAPPLPRGAFDPARPQAAPPPSSASASDARVGADADIARRTSELRLSDADLGAAPRPALHVDVPPPSPSGAVSDSKSALAAAEFLATRVFDVPSFSALSRGADELNEKSDAAAAVQHASSSAVLSALAPRCEAAEVDSLAAGWAGAVLVGPVPSVHAGNGSGSLGSTVGSPSSRAAPTTPLGLAGRHHSKVNAGYMEAGAGRVVEEDDDEEHEDEEEEEDHRTLYVTLPEPAPAPTPPKSPASGEKPLSASASNTGSTSPIDEKKAILSPLSQTQQRRPLPTRKPSSSSSSVAATLRHAVLNILDLASETLSCSTVVFVLERSRPDLADLLHGLCYVGGQVLHVKGASSRRYGGGGGGPGSARGLMGSPASYGRGSVGGMSWDQRTPRGSPATHGMQHGGSGSGATHRGSYGSIGSITAQFPGSVVMPVRIHAGRDGQQAELGSGGGAAAGDVLGDDDMLLLPRADVILVAVAL